VKTPRSLHTIDLEVTLKTPCLVHGNDPGHFGLDASLIRDHDGHLILPGSLIVGRIRAAWAAMAELDLPVLDASQCFGRVGHQDGDRSRIWSKDLSSKTSAAELQLSTRVPIDVATGAPQNGMLMMIEQTQKAGSRISFTGRWRAFLSSDEVCPLKGALLAGLLWHSQLGAQRSVGFGELLSASVVVEAATNARVDSVSGTHARLTLDFEQAICVAARSRGNVFESGDIIPGATIKGALASLIRAQFGETVAERKSTSKLAEHFDAIRVSHAFPSATYSRPGAIPMSLVATKRGNEQKIWDVAELAVPQLIERQAPAFCHDWKAAVWDEVNGQRQWGQTREHLRVRTAIDEGTRTAEEGKLFAYQCVVAEEAVRWLADLSFAAVAADDRAAVWQELADLLAYGLGPVGKTDAWARTELGGDCASVWQQQMPRAGEFIRLTLNTPALLLASNELANTPHDLQQLYAAAFASLSGGALQLSHFYASHRMAGGDHLHQRRGGEAMYLPLVLADAGSVFVLSVAAGKVREAETVLRDWQSQGLPLPPTVVAEHGDKWQDHSYLPENGFGEVVINPLHGFAVPQAHQLSPC